MGYSFYTFITFTDTGWLTPFNSSERISNPSTSKLPDLTLSSLIKISPAAALAELVSAHLPAVQTKHRYQWISNPQLRELCRSKLEAQLIGKALLGIWDK